MSCECGKFCLPGSVLQQGHSLPLHMLMKLCQVNKIWVKAVDVDCVVLVLSLLDRNKEGLSFEGS